MLFKTFGWSIAITIIGLAVAFLYGGSEGIAVAAILIVLEISLSFDNAVVNATIVKKLNPFWQRIFLTVGVLIAVFGMRLVFPLLLVGITASLNPVEAVRLALEKGDPHVPGTYGYLLNDAHPAIAGFGGMFLFILFLDFIFEDREIKWLTWLEKPLARLGRLDQLSVVVATGVLVIVAETLAGDDAKTVLVSGILGLVTYLVVNGLGELFSEAGEGEDGAEQGGTNVVLLAGRAAFFSFLYLEVLDASFSFDGVIGAFAITQDPIIIALGLGVGAMYIRSITVYLVRQGSLDNYVYLEHGAHWAIGALAIILFFSIEYHIPEVVTGLIGLVFIVLALVTSIRRNNRLRASGQEVEHVGA